MKRTFRPRLSFVAWGVVAWLLGACIEAGAAPPRATPEGIQFSFEAPASARRVFIAGDFNAWAHNEGGRIADASAQMQRREGALWTTTVRIGSDLARYKFVVEDESGRFTWQADPSAPDRDRDGNSLLVTARAGADLQPLASTTLLQAAADRASGRLSVVMLDERAGIRDALGFLPVLVDGEEHTDLQGEAPLTSDDLEIEAEPLSERTLALTFTVRSAKRRALSIRLRDNSHYYGAGERFHALDQKGFILPMVSADRPENKGVSTYKPVPFVMSTRGYALWVDSSAPGSFDLNASRRDTISVDYRAPRLRLVLIAGPGLASMLEEFTRLTGRPAVPPAWAFAPWKSRDVHRSREDVIADAELTRRHRLPGSVVVIDSPWETSYNDFTLNREQFKEPESMFDRLHELGFVPCFWLTPFINSRSITDMRGIDPGPSPNFAEAAAKGYLVRSRLGGPMIATWWKGDGGLVDFTSPEAVAWWHGQLEKMLPWGASAIKCDDGEGTFVQDAVFADGTPAEDMKSRYAALYLKAADEFLQKHRGPDHALLARSGFTGSGRYPFGWAGDNEASWSFDNGLPGVILAAQNAALSGQPLWGCDIAGYIGNATPELFIRWTQFAAFTPLMQVHMQSNKGPWDFGEEALDIYRTYARLHTSLTPYIVEAAHEAAERGLPIVRPLALAFEGDARAAAERFEYMFGPDLLIAPMYRPGVRREVYLPRGAWLDFWTGGAHAGGTESIVDVPLARTPLFVRSGAIIPRLPEDLDTLLPRTDHINPGVRCPGDLRVIELWPGEPRALRTYEGLSVSAERNGNATVYTIAADPPRPVEARVMFRSVDQCAIEASPGGHDARSTPRGVFITIPALTGALRIGVAD
jgi:alpha-D-xyloside xylohydrolase